MHKVFIKNYGCQMNIYDSEKMYSILKSIDYTESDEIENSDLIILNTCHIREKATEKIYSELGKYSKLKKTIVVAGCVSQAEGNIIFKRAPYVNIVVGPQSYHLLPGLIRKHKQGENHLIELKFEPSEKFDIIEQNIDNSNLETSKFVSIQEGCDKFCTFCVVPYTRGPEISRPIENIIKEVKTLSERGTKEITLLGQNVNAYNGRDINNKISDISDLISLVAKISNIERIRYTTSHPIDVNDKLIDIHANEEKLMPFLHLPVQSGSNKILKSMNRQHTKEYYLNIIERFLEKNDKMRFSSDFIVGFPGETDKDFLDTLNLARQVKYTQAFSFKYSQRPGTPADKRKDQIDEEIKSQRLIELQKILFQHQLEFNNSFLNKKIPVLFDRVGRILGQTHGKTPYFQTVLVESDNSILGETKTVQIEKTSQNCLIGNLVN